MGQKKLARFEELGSFKNVLQFPTDMAGKWKDFFGNDKPITLELACGKGEYTLGLAQLYPGQNFIGIDLKGNRIWVGARKALNEGFSNVAFLRTQIDHINSYFSAGEVSGIWITFPDPQLRISKAKKRLTHPKFLRLYQQFLSPGGLIHLKTDSPDLYAFTKQVIGLYDCELHTDIDDIYNQQTVPQELLIKTHYESLDIAGSSRVHYLSFSLPPKFPGVAMEEKLKQVLKNERTDCPKDSFGEGIHYYYNDEGLVVLTETYHLEKGFCCGNGCIHCPYEYNRVDEPRRSELLQQRADRNK